MLNKRSFYIDGQWVTPHTPNDIIVIDPSTEKPCAIISNGTQDDVDKAVHAAKHSFAQWSSSNPKERLDFVSRILDIYRKRADDMAKAISLEMGAPIDMATQQQVESGDKHIENFINAFYDFHFSKAYPQNNLIAYDSIGVVGLITPWNWPMNQVTLKVIPALLAGCTMVFKPSEIAPLSSMLFAEIIHDAGIPKGVFNLVNGDGAGVGTALSGHPDIAMISFTGSTRAGKAISKNAAETLKRVCLELGGKGANIIFADADDNAVKRGVLHCFNNTGQSCNAPTRMLIEKSIYEQALEQAKLTVQNVSVGSAHKHGNHLGPVVSKAQFNKVQGLIQSGIDEGATLLAGGVGHPEGLENGYFVRPTIFAHVTPKMRIANEEIFGPVLSIIPFETEEEAIQIANDTEYGLTHYVQSLDIEKCRRVARQLRSGMVQMNGQPLAKGMFFGGVKHSGNAREGGLFGILEFLDSKAISGWN